MSVIIQFGNVYHGGIFGRIQEAEDPKLKGTAIDFQGPNLHAYEGKLVEMRVIPT